MSVAHKKRREVKTDRPADIRSLAEELAELYSEDDRTDVIRMIEADGITVSFNHYGDAFDGALEHKGGRFHIYCNLDRVRFRGSPRARFTLAHELAHFHIDEHRAALEAGLAPMHGSFCNRPEAELLVEQEADEFASHLLLPSGRYDQFLAKTSKIPPGLPQVTAVAEHFDVSLQATAIRHCQTDASACGIVMWRTGEAPWSMVSRHWEALGYRRPRRDPAAIAPGSATARAYEERDMDAKSRFGNIQESVTTTSFWFGHVAHGGHRDAVLSEQAIRLGNYGVLTLLRIKA